MTWTVFFVNKYFILYYIYLINYYFLIFGCVRSSLWHAGSFLLLLRRVGFSLVVVCGFSLSSCGAWAPEYVDSVVCGTQALYLFTYFKILLFFDCVGSSLLCAGFLSLW